MRRLSPIIPTLLLLAVVSTALFGQHVNISATVRDMNTHREISGVNVLVRGTRQGVSTNAAGLFLLHLPQASPATKIIFSHIGYEPLEMDAQEVLKSKDIYLQPRVIPLKGVAIEGEAGLSRGIQHDLPQVVATIDRKTFEIRGYVDAGDLLRLDHSIQVDEELSGKKTVAIRGGNADDVVVMFNGIKMNDAYDNVFDLALIDLEDIERFEIIKGSNTALYGPEAFSGVINIVPKLEQNYTVRFQQRLGTYRSGNWGLHLYKQYKNLKASYSYKRGGIHRVFVDATSAGDRLTNLATHHTGNLSYRFSDHADGRAGASLNAMWLYSSLSYDNQRDNEQIANTNLVFSVKYRGRVPLLRDVDLTMSYRTIEEDQFFSDAGLSVDRFIEDRTFGFNAEKHVVLGQVDLLLAYQYQGASLDFLNDLNLRIQPTGLKSAALQRRHHGFVTVLKYRARTGSDFLDAFNLETSIRHDRTRDSEHNPVLYDESAQDASGNVVGLFGENDWHDTMLKMGVRLDGYRENLAFNGFLNFGSNVKFPSLFQQTNSAALFSRVATQPNLNPEKSRSFELGATVARDLRGETSLYGFQVSASYFQTFYDNKFRRFSTPGSSVAFYDNSRNASISGIESTSAVFLLKKKVTVELGISRYFISERAAFPFKSDHKATLRFSVDHAGYSFQLFGFVESEQTALLRQQGNRFTEVTLPDYRNLDLHFSKSLEIGGIKVFANASIRNVLNDDDVALVGLAIRDRRFYLTLGAQY